MPMKIDQYLRESNVTQSEFARSIGVTQPFVWQWISGSRPVPIGHCVAIERITSGAVSRRDLRPNDWQRIWPELAKEPEHV